MKTGSGNRSHHQQARIKQVYPGETSKGRDDSGVSYTDYYDFPDGKGSRRRSETTTVVVTSVVILVVLAVIVLGLSLLKPQESTPSNLVTAVPISTDANQITQTAVGSSEPPVIYGVNPIVVYAGSPVAYKDGVYVEDDTDPDPMLEIDNADVDLTTPGTYVVAYIATDRDQNVTQQFTTITVLEGAELIGDDEIYALADRVLDSIIPDDSISDAMKCLKVYEYLHAIGYVDEVHSEDWMQNAYWMLTRREGDCFCYYSAARLLLTRLGYEVMEVRNNNNYVHYWCLVSIDGGSTWWHFDPCCWSWGEDGILCLVSDTYLQEFTRRHYTSDGRLIHAWDLTKYPATPMEDFWTDEDRSVIYESGLIDINAQYDESLWINEGWDNYQIPYAYEIPEEYYYYDDSFETDYQDSFEYDPDEEIEYDPPTEETIMEDFDYEGSEDFMTEYMFDEGEVWSEDQ